MVSDQILAEIAAGKGAQLTRLSPYIPSYRNGRPATLSRLLRWVLHGVLAPDGSRVYLEAVRLPSGWVSTSAALSRFFAALTPAPQGTAPAPRPSPKASQRRAAKSAEKLTTLGV